MLCYVCLWGCWWVSLDGPGKSAVSDGTEVQLLNTGSQWIFDSHCWAYRWLWNLCVHQHCTAKVTIFTVMSVCNPDMTPCLMMSSSNLEVMSVLVLLPRSPLSWWYQQVTWMWCHAHHTNFHAGLVHQWGSLGKQLPSTRASALPADQINYCCVGLSNGYICS